MTHTGIISARIQFTKPIQVSWVQDNGTESPIGVMELSELHASHKRATVDQVTQFNITDEDMFGVFAGHMITAKNFTWRLQSDSLHVQAAKFPTSKGIKFNKLVTLNGTFLVSVWEPMLSAPDCTPSPCLLPPKMLT